MEKVVILGAGGQARDVLDVFLARNSVNPRYEILGFIDENPAARGLVMNGAPVLGGFEWFRSGPADAPGVILGIGSPETKRKLANKALALGLRFATVVHPAAAVAPFGRLGEGVVITAGCVLANRAVLEDHVYVNMGSTIGHDCLIEEYCNIAPGVNISGNVHLKPGCDIGTGAAILQGITIGEGAVVGAGAVVLRDVPPNSVSVGVPARVVKQKEEPWKPEMRNPPRKTDPIHAGGERRP